MSQPCHQLQELFHREIPLTKALNLRVMDWNGDQLTLQLPLQNNINHMHSMFGGSLYCGAVLAGWGWLHLRLREAGINDGHIVIQEGLIEYPRPVEEDAIALCASPGDTAWRRFESIYRRYGRARITLNSRILRTDGQEGVHFTGQYVLHT